jgi:hypothetical protein
MSSPAALTQTSLIADALAHLPMLTRQVQDGIHEAINGNPQHRQLLEPWQRHRLRFVEHFEQALTPLLAAGARGEDPLPRRTPRGLDELSLVDERQALHDVSLAQVIQAVEDGSRNELYQLGNFFAALRGTARARKDDNPLRPGVFGHALQQALSWPELDAEGHYAVMRVAAQPLAKALQPLYTTLCAQLRAADLAPLIASRGLSQQSADQERLRRVSRAYENLPGVHTEPATLDGLARRVDAYNSRPQLLGALSEGNGRDLLTRLYDQILADPRLLPPVKALLARLQVVVVRLAASDPSLLRRQDHPTWKLLNRVGSHGAAFERADEPRLQDFLRFMNACIDEVAAQPRPGAAQFQDLLDRVEAFISQQARQGGERSSIKLAGLERERQRESWLRVLAEQIRDQLAESPEARTSALLRDFLRKDWTRVIVQAMVEHGRDAPQAQARIELVDALLASLRPLRNEAERQALRARLPALVQALNQGCESIALPAARCKALMDELMHLHGRLLLGPTGQPLAPEPQHVPPMDPEAQLQALLSERESLQGSRWAHDEVDRSRLPTVPVGLYSMADAAASRQALNQWIAGLSIGRWYHLFVQSQWTTAQLAWVSDSRQYFLFVGQDDEERHSLTRGALEHLLSHGLITALEDEGDIVQRAMSTLMQDLDSAGPA